MKWIQFEKKNNHKTLKWRNRQTLSSFDQFKSSASETVYILSLAVVQTVYIAVGDFIFVFHFVRFFLYTTIECKKREQKQNKNIHGERGGLTVKIYDKEEEVDKIKVRSNLLLISEFLMC